jgi:putative OPT family oligopeptide transporter
LGIAFVYAILQRAFKIVIDTASFATKSTFKFFPSANVAADITPEYLGVGYIIGFRIAGILVAGGVLSWLVFIPLLSSLIPDQMIALQQVKLGLLQNINASSNSYGNWNVQTHLFADKAEAIYRAYIRQIGAGAVAAGGFISLIKTIPTIITSFKESISSVKEKGNTETVSRTDKDMNIKVVLFGSIALIVLMALLPIIPGDTILNKMLVGLLVVVFGAFFVTVSSRIVGIIGSSNNPISGMTIATVMSTCLIFVAVGWSGQIYEPMALVVGAMVCIAAANAGATSQDLKTGYLVGSTPKSQQMALFVGAIVSSIVIGITIKILDTPSAAMAANGITHAIGTKYNAPQATLMATLIKGILSFNLDWNFVLVGAALAVVIELCGIKSLNFAVGVYLPLSTTLPIFIGGAIRGLVDWMKKRKGIISKEGEEDLQKGNLFATGLVAGGSLMGVIFAFLGVNEFISTQLEKISLQHFITQYIHEDGYSILGVLIFGIMGWLLYLAAMKKSEIGLDEEI